MKSTHTPGPWTYDTDDKLNMERAFGIVRLLGAAYDAEAGTNNATEVIAEVCGDDGSGRAEADARLIAAAPELLAALETTAKWVAQYHGTPGHDAASKSMSRFIEAAIAKAKGVA